MILYLLMETQCRRTHSFFKGISLSEYMKEIPCPQELESQGENEETNDLYLQCEPQSNIANYAIRQIMDQENYDETRDKQDLIVQPLHNFDLQRARIVQVEEIKNKGKLNPIRKPNLIPTNRNHSNSPNKDILSPKKEMFRSLYGHSFGGQQRHERGHLLSTLGMNNWGRGKNKSLNKKELEQRDKNKRQYQQLIKYESVISQRLDTKLNSIRIDGIKDKIHERNERFNRKDNRL